MDQQFSLRWNNYLNQITDAFGSLRNEEDLIDVTLSCEGKRLKAHKMLLSACSSYFRDIFKENPCQHPVIVFRNVKYADLEAIVEFMYRGEVNVLQDQLETFLGTAELLEVKGLTDGSGKDNAEEEERSSISKTLQGTVTAPISPQQKNKSQPQVSFIPVSSRPATPPSKKRKHSNSGKGPERKQRSGEVVTPVMPKIEKEEFIEDLTFDEDEDVDFAPPSATEPLQGLTTSKPDYSVEFSTNSNSPEDQQDSNILSMGQMLIPEPGTSAEDCVQVEEVDVTVAEKEEVVGNEAENKTKNDEVKYNDKKFEEIDNSTKISNMELENGNTSLNKQEENINMDTSNKHKDPVTKKADKTSEMSQGLKTESRKIVQSKHTLKLARGVLPKGLLVTVRPIVKKQIQSECTTMDLNLLEPGAVHTPEDYDTFRSEEAKTPVQEETSIYQPGSKEQSKETDVDGSARHILSEESETAEEAPEEVSEGNENSPLVEEEKEPEFDYYGCEVCKADAKPVEKFNFTHKCPICPCMCFCAHILKDHMKVIHGWFNVQRRFKQY